MHLTTKRRAAKLLLAVLTATAAATPAGAGDSPTSMKIVAGSGVAGFADGTDARFNKPILVYADRLGIADLGNHRIVTVSLKGP